MNPLSIELYRRYKYDITKDPLEFAVLNQHMNGGLAVDAWGETTLEGCYAIGEAAGAHGVTRPGGAALNAGQVFGTRCAESIASKREATAASPPERDLIEGALSDILAVLRSDSPIKVEAIRNEVQARMSDHAGIICTAADVQSSLAGASALNSAIRQRGVAFDGAYGAVRALQWRQMAIASEAVLAALSFYIERGGGSRGARTICSPDGNQVPLARTGPLTEFRFRSERAEDRAEQIPVRLEGDRFTCGARPVRRRDRGSATVLRTRLARFPHRRDLRSQHLKFNRNGAVGATIRALMRGRRHDPAPDVHNSFKVTLDHGTPSRHGRYPRIPADAAAV